MPRLSTLAFALWAHGLCVLTSFAASLGLGYVLPGEAAVWVETPESAAVEILLHPYAGAEAAPLRFGEQSQQVDSPGHHRAVLTLGGLRPGSRYRYEVRLNGEATGLEGAFRTPPSPGEAFGEAYQILLAGRMEAVRGTVTEDLDASQALVAAGGDAMIWLGGQHAGSAATASPSVEGFRRIFGALAADPVMAPFFASTAQWSVWGASDVPRSAQGPLGLHGAMARTAFCGAWPRPACGHPGFGGMVNQVRLGPAEFFFIDAVSFRESGRAGRSARLLGDAQMEWLLEALQASDAPFRFIVAGLPLLPGTRGAENWRAVEAERAEFLNRLLLRNPPGVFVLSGDAPFGELSRVDRTARYPLHELTLGPLRQADPVRQPPLNMDRQPGTFAAQAHFAKLTLGSARNDWSLTVEVFDGGGQLLWRDHFLASELVRPPH
jgi:alkaline phosphatase D